jgi:signal peptidase I
MKIGSLEGSLQENLDRRISESESLKPSNSRVWGILFRSLDILAMSAMLVFILVFIFWINPTTISGISMANTYKTGNVVLIDIVSKDLHRKDIITLFADNQDTGSSIPNVINTLYQGKIKDKPRDILVKRVIALPGEKVEMVNKVVTIYNSENPNGIVLDEPYAKNDWVCTPDEQSEPVRAGNAALNYPLTEIKAGEVFVLGDNRGCSKDSRVYNAFKQYAILGKVIKKVI